MRNHLCRSESRGTDGFLVELGEPRPTPPTSLAGTCLAAQAWLTDKSLGLSEEKRTSEVSVVAKNPVWQYLALPSESYFRAGTVVYMPLTAAQIKYQSALR